MRRIFPILAFLTLAVPGCNIFVPDWGEAGKRCNDPSQCRGGRVCDPRGVCVDDFLELDLGNYRTQYETNCSPGDILLSLAAGGDDELLVLGCRNSPADSRALELGLYERDNREIIWAASRHHPWETGPCNAIGPLLVLPGAEHLIAGCQDNQFNDLVWYERSSGWTSQRWQSLSARSMVVSTEFEGDNRYVAVLDTPGDIHWVNVATNAEVLAEPFSISDQFLDMTFDPSDPSHLAVGICNGAQPPLGLLLAVPVGNAINPIPKESDQACVRSLSYIDNGDLLIGLTDTNPGSSPNLFGWDFQTETNAFTALACPGCKQVVAFTSPGQQQYAVVSAAEGTDTKITCYLVSFASGWTFSEIGSIPSTSLKGMLGPMAISQEHYGRRYLAVVAGSTLHLFDLYNIFDVSTGS